MVSPMTEREKELEEKLAQRELSLLRAWDALQKVRKVVEQYRGPSREHGKPKNFEAEGEYLAKEVQTLIDRSQSRAAAISTATINIEKWIGRPVAESDRPRFEVLRRELQKHMDGMGVYGDSEARFGSVGG